MKTTDITSFNFDVQKKNLPTNIYALRILDDENKHYDIVITHNGYCPNLSTEREQSNYNDYLSNLEYDVVDEFFKSSKIKKPKNYSHIFEIMTNSEGELYHYSKQLIDENIC
jgi:hypothetical protein